MSHIFIYEEPSQWKLQSLAPAIPENAQETASQPVYLEFFRKHFGSHPTVDRMELWQRGKRFELRYYVGNEFKGCLDIMHYVLRNHKYHAFPMLDDGDTMEIEIMAYHIILRIDELKKKHKQSVY